MSVIKTKNITCLLVGIICSLGPVSAETVTFQQGVDNYAGTSDTSLFQDKPDTMISGSKGLFVQNGEKDGEPNQRHILIRFDDIFGAGPNQIPADATIDNATVTMVCQYGYSPDGGLEVFELIRPFKDGTTWNNFGDGVTVGEDTASDPVGAFSIFSNKKDNAVVDVTASITAWVANPSANLGWSILEADRVGFDGTSAAFASEAEAVETRPILTVEFTPAEPADPTEPE
ncbi:MAG: DNRLRE domain-containing protein [Planctomycetota bacterium]